MELVGQPGFAPFPGPVQKAWDVCLVAHRPVVPRRGAQRWVPGLDPAVGGRQPQRQSRLLALFIPKQPKLPKDDKKADLDLSRPGPHYDTNFTPYEGARYYTISVPALPEGISCAYLRVEYLGDTGALYQKGELVADKI